MLLKNLHEPFAVEYRTVSESIQSAHQHSFFELVYIIDGTGRQCINKNSINYRAGNLFLITPEDCHSFEVNTQTDFFYLRFNNIYIDQNLVAMDMQHKLEYILQNANHKPGCILCNFEDKMIVKALIEAIGREYVNKDVYNQELVRQYVNTLILLVARNITRLQQLTINEKSEQRATDLLHFVQSNIFYPDKLKASYLSNHFHISAFYIGRYFKKHAGQSLQDYITAYKIKLIEHRLRYSDKRINEIASEFGFTDESHFNKFFKKQNEVSPRTYRNGVVAAAIDMNMVSSQAFS